MAAVPRVVQSSDVYLAPRRDVVRRFFGLGEECSAIRLFTSFRTSVAGKGWSGKK
jgi:hypothetical protein